MTKKEEIKLSKSEQILSQFEKQPDDKYRLKLSSPIKRGSDTFFHLDLSEPKAKHMKKIPKDPDLSDMLVVFAELSGEALSTIDELSLKDMNKLSEFIEAFS